MEIVLLNHLHEATTTTSVFFFLSCKNKIINLNKRMHVYQWKVPTNVMQHSNSM